MVASKGCGSNQGQLGVGSEEQDYVRRSHCQLEVCIEIHQSN